MDEELVFRIVFWVQLFLVLFFNRVLPALRARKSGTELMPDESAVKNEGGIYVCIRISLFVLILAVVSFYSIYPRFMDILHIGFPLWIRWLGTLISFVGLAFWIYSQSVLDINWSAQLRIQKEHQLVDTGPYRIIRHPIYSAMFLWTIGLILCTASAVFIVLAALMIVALIARVPKEEKMMIGQFGDKYRKYMLTTGRYFPKLRGQGK